MRSRFRSQPGPDAEGQGRPVELIRVRGAQRLAGDEGYRVRARSRRRGGRGRRRGRGSAPQPPKPTGFFAWLRSLFGGRRDESRARNERRTQAPDRQEERALSEWQRQFGITFRDPGQLKLALTHRSYLSVTGQGPRESNERLEFLGDSVLGLVTSEYLYRRHPDEHEGQLTKTKSLLVSKAILSRRALRMGLGRFVLMSHSEVESGGRQRLSILADAFESVLGAIYLDQGFEVARAYIHKHLLEDSDEIVADKRHTNYKSHLQEYVQSTYRTHPVYRIRSEYGPDHSKHFMVEVMVGRRTLGEGRGHNKKEAEQAAARDALENVRRVREPAAAAQAESSRTREDAESREGTEPRRRRRRRGGRGRGSDAVAPLEAAGAEAPLEDEAALEPADAYEAEERELAEDALVADVAGDDELEDVVDDLDDEDEEVVEEDDEDDDLDDDDEEEDEDEEDDDQGGEPAAGPKVLGSGIESGVDRLTLASRPVEPAAPPSPPRPPVATPVRAEAPAPSFGRGPRRGGQRPPAPAPAPAQDEPPRHEEALVDPFAMEAQATPPAEPAPPEPDVAPEPVDDGDDAGREARIEEMERALSSFGRTGAYGRRGKPGKRRR